MLKLLNKGMAKKYQRDVLAWYAVCHWVNSVGRGDTETVNQIRKHLVSVGKPDTVVNINFFWVDCISGHTIYLKDNATVIHHWGSMCYVLGYVSVLVVILNEEEEIWYDTVLFEIKFEFQCL